MSMEVRGRKGRRKGRRNGRGASPRRRLICLALFALMSGAALAQESRGDRAEAEPVLGLASFGVSAGFPAYQTLALNAAVQYRYFGLAVRGSWSSAAGVYGAFALRGYPPVPGMPVPVFLEAGVGGHAGGAVPFAAIGAHVPLAQRLRLDLEAGAARVPLLDRTNTVPFLSLGLSYAFSFDVAELVASGRNGPASATGTLDGTGPGLACDLEPDESQLGSAMSATISEFLRDARATYGSLYTGLAYSYDVRDQRVDGQSAVVSLTYRGSVTEIASGKRISASGSATARYRWNGCSWRRTGLNY
ncbi:MAG: hypothetical protein WD314_09400 [Trueperaceae bacterium]